MSGDEILLIPRSRLFAACRNMSDPRMEAIERTAQEIFPFPPNQLFWTHVVSEPLGGDVFVLFLATICLPPPSGEGWVGGICPRFIAAWKWLANVRPKLATQDAVVLRDAVGPETELTFFHRGFPLFCGSEIEKVLPYLNRAHGLALGAVSEIIDVPVGALESFISSVEESEIPWLVKPEKPVSVAGRLWRRHKDNALAAAAALFILTSLALERGIDRKQERLSALRHDLRRSASPSGTGAVAIAPGLALKAFAETARRAPASAHLTSFRFDAAAKSVLVDGRAADYARVSDYVAALSKSDLFRDVQSERTRLEPVDGHSVVAFSLKGALR